jgi:hypothetical protein
VVSSSTAASALPQTLTNLLTVADTPEAIAEATIKLLRNRSDTTSQELRTTLKTYIDHLDLGSQLHRIIADPTESAEKKQEIQQKSDRQTLLHPA